jgi:hypothetical protein
VPDIPVLAGELGDRAIERSREPGSLEADPRLEDPGLAAVAARRGEAGLVGPLAVPGVGVEVKYRRRRSSPATTRVGS